MKSISSFTNRASINRYANQSALRQPPLRHGLLAIVLATTSGLSQAVEFGPDNMFSFSGFALASFGVQDKRCLNCQWAGPTEGKQKIWADTILPGRPIENVSTQVLIVQPYLGAKFKLGQGFKFETLLSQRWRDGFVDGKRPYDDRTGSKVDIPGFWYEKNVTLSHEDYGRLTIGATTTRSWAEADYPFGSNLGLAEAWSSSGAGYGLLTNAIRYQSRLFDVAEGDLVLEGTYDRGETNFKKNKPSFFEFFGKYWRGPLELSLIVQDTKNGGPGSWGHNPFTGLTASSLDDPLLSKSSQGITMVMGRYWATPQLELSAGIRRNWWSGANAVQNPNTLQWNNMFNVNWNGTLNGVANPGYPASSYDVVLGARYRVGKWTPSIGMLHFGTAKTDNPSNRGQDNSALLAVLGLQYAFDKGDFGRERNIDFSLGTVHYANRGLSPISMPGNDAFTAVDSRIAKNGHWFNVQITYGF